MNSPRLIIVMGVSGCGKSTIARELATALSGVYLDADDYHPPENIAKMSGGAALEDADRWPWLKHFAEVMAGHSSLVVGACSALRQTYREHLTTSAGEAVLFVYLEGTKALIHQRIMAREDHFMPDSLLDSQFATLEPPTADEFAVSIDIQGTVQQITEAIVAALKTLKDE